MNQLVQCECSCLRRGAFIHTHYDKLSWLGVIQLFCRRYCNFSRRGTGGLYFMPAIFISKILIGAFRAYPPS